MGSYSCWTALGVLVLVLDQVLLRVLPPVPARVLLPVPARVLLPVPDRARLLVLFLVLHPVPD
jgi:hypothetical protein